MSNEVQEKKSFLKFYKIKWCFALFVILGVISNPVLANKITIAITNIEYRAKDSSENKSYNAYGKGSREDTRAFVDMMTTALVKTRKFDVIERDRMAEILQEQGLSVNGLINGGYDGDTMSLQGVDYIITGAITEYGESSNQVGSSAFAFKSSIATMSIDVRVLNVANGSIEFADTVEGKAKINKSALSVEGIETSSSGGGASKLLGQVMRETATKITNLVVSAIYPIKVITVTSKGDIMLNYGDGILKNGDVLAIYSQGETIIDPDTGEELGSEEELIAKIEVFSAQTKFSKATTLKGFDSNNIKKGMIARLLDKKEAKKSKKKKKKNKKSRW